MKKIKLIAVDIGGSLITNNNTITNKNIETLKEMKNIGIKIVLITARMYSSTRYISNVIEADYGVFGNGSNIMNLNNLSIYYNEIIPYNILKKLILFGKNNGLYIHLNELLCETSDEKKYFTLKHLILNQNYPEELKSNINLVNNINDYIKENSKIVKIIFVSENNMDEIYFQLKEKFPNIFINEYSKNLYESTINKKINYIEVGIKNNNKADGLTRLIKKLHIEPDEVIVIGDGDNDIDMFKKFKNSGCLLNGSKLAKENASYISKFTNNKSGVSEIINYFVQRGQK